MSYEGPIPVYLPSRDKTWPPLLSRYANIPESSAYLHDDASSLNPRGLRHAPPPDAHDHVLPGAQPV